MKGVEPSVSCGRVGVSHLGFLRTMRVIFRKLVRKSGESFGVSEREVCSMIVASVPEVLGG
jgi:hypothetical protein